MFRLFGLLLVGLVLAGCAEMVAEELAMRAISGVSKAVNSGSSHLSAGISETKLSHGPLPYISNYDICRNAKDKNKLAIQEAKIRGLSCGAIETLSNHVASNLMPCPTDVALFWTNCFGTVIADDGKYVGEFKDNKAHGQGTFIYTTDHEVDKYVGGFKGNKLHGQGTIFFANGDKYVGGFKDNKRHGQGKYYFSDGTGLTGYFGNSSSETPSSQMASSSASHQPSTPTLAELTAAQKEALRLQHELAALKAQQELKQQTISNDNQIPLITIASANTKGKQGVIRGRASDNVGVAEVTIDGNAVAVQSNGSFEYSTFVPATGLTVTVQATDMAGLSSKQTVSLQRNVNLASATISFDRLNPIGKRTEQNNNALALIIGVSDYENTPAKAVFADADAMMFRDYASEKLGIPDSRIKTMVNDGAGERELLLSVKSWLSRLVKQNQSDVYIFFAGHGLASDDGSKMYLLPYDGAPELLDKTAILRDELFADISAANPRSVTVFLDTCYSGTTRGTDMLIASRSIAIRALVQSIPDNFTVMTAAAGDQTAKPLEEAKHGMFSYFLMKGMEGEADANNDNEITAGELHSYVQANVIQQSSGSQTPELQGDVDRVLVRFQ
jgi:uncharacterized caspase-like protein